MIRSDILIIGAGISGLITARELSRKGLQVTILEARNRTGGRIITFKDSSFSHWTEGGPEFIHGNQKETFRLLKEYKIKYHPVKGRIVRIRHGEAESEPDFVPEHHHMLSQKLKALKRDTSVGQFLDRHFSADKFAALRRDVQGFVEGYETAQLEDFSVLMFRKEWDDADDWKQYRLENGYGELVNRLTEDCKNLGCNIKLKHVVRKVEWTKHSANVECTNGKSFHARQVIIALPLGILKRNQIEFTPGLESKTKSIQSLGYGDVIKILLQFKTPFWLEAQTEKRIEEKLSKLFFLFSKEKVPTWWTQAPSSNPLLTGWLAGPKAKSLSGKTNQEIIEHSIQSLASIFKMKKTEVRAWLKGSKVFNWSSDPRTLGSYAYTTVGAEKNREIMKRPVQDTLFFTGEYLADEPGTVEAALQSGIETTGKIES